MFASGEQGIWYGPNNLSTLFQDSAFTVPVTAVEQPVGGILDLSGRGNHATQATTTKRPVYSRRVNLLDRTEGVFPATPIGILSDTAEGNLRRVVESTATVPHFFSFSYPNNEGERQQFSFDVKRGSGSRHVALNSAGGTVGAVFNLDTFTVSKLNGTTATDMREAGIFPVGDGVYRCWLTWRNTSTFTGGNIRLTFATNTINADSANESYAGDGVSSLLLGRVSLVRVGLAFSGYHPYQWVNTGTDYDADPAKFPAYLRWDGVDDSLASSTGGGGTAGFFFSAAISPQGSAGTARTLFSDAGANTGYIVRLNTSNQLELAAGNGTTYTTIATAGTLAVGATAVVQAWDDGLNLNVKIGSGPTASVARPAVLAGTAGYTLGQDNGASSGYFNGRIYGEIYRKDSSPTQTQREAVALYQRQKAKLP